MNAERILLGLLLGGIAIGCALVLMPFVSALLWAGILVFSTWPVFEWVRDRLRVRGSVAAAIMVLLATVIVVLPLALAAPGGASDMDDIRRTVQDAIKAGLPAAPRWVEDIPLVGTTLAGTWNAWTEDLSGLIEVVRPYFGMIAESGLGIALALATGVVSFLLALFMAFFFYIYGEPIARRMRAILRRVAGPQVDRLIALTGATVRGTVYGILGTAIVQGLLTSIGLLICGVPRAWLLGAIAGFLSVLPIGAPVVWIPASLWLMGTGQLPWGIFLFVYGFFAISGSDNIIRPYFISKGANLPFLITVLGVLGGALAFGLLGIFLGPVLLGVGYTLVKEYAQEEAPEPALARIAPAPAAPVAQARPAAE